MASFNYLQEPSRVSWPQTIMMNMIRMIFGSLVIAPLVWAKSHDSGAWSLIVGLPVAWLIVGLPAWIICQRLAASTAKNIVAIGFVLPFLVVGLIGDPFIFFISKIRPALIPVIKPDFMSFSAVTFVLKP